MSNPEATIRLNRMRFGIYSWQGQAPQYDQLGPPDEIVYRRFIEPKVGSTLGPGTVIDTLLSYDDQGYLVGILNTYPYGAVERDGTVLDKPGNVCVTLRPDADKDVHQALLRECMRRWNVTEDTEVQFCMGASAQRWTVKELLMDGNRRISRLGNPNR